MVTLIVESATTQQTDDLTEKRIHPLAVDEIWYSSTVHDRWSSELSEAVMVQTPDPEC